MRDPGAELDRAWLWTSAAAGCLLSALASLEEPEASRELLNQADSLVFWAGRTCEDVGVL